MILRGRRPTSRARSGGIGIIAAIAILVILAGLAAFIVSVVVLRSQSTGLDSLGTRAYLAARAGVEWNMYWVNHPAAPPFTCPGGVFGTLNNGNGLGGMLADFTVTVTCQTTTTATEAGNTIRIHQIVAVACNIPTGGACPNNATTNTSYVERKITAQTETCTTPANAPC